jgi:hypothetical protein
MQGSYQGNGHLITPRDEVCKIVFVYIEHFVESAYRLWVSRFALIRVHVENFGDFAEILAVLRKELPGILDVL